MGNVIIIKNNNEKGEIHKHAMESYKKGEERYYNSMDKTSNESYIKEIKSQLQDEKKGDVFLLLITYSEDKVNTTIKDMFIGECVEINEKNNILYRMYIQYEAPEQERTIQSIVDKIDLDLGMDFSEYHYVMNSKMDVLYQELKERLEAKIGVCRSEDMTSMPISASERNSAKYCMSALAQKDDKVIRIYEESKTCGGKNEYQIDRERIVNSEAFRRMVDKAQIFSAEKGDYFRTRMTHTLEVNQIAKAIAYALGLNLDLIEAIALGHDLGHTPFGHQGERTLDEILAGDVDVGIVWPNNYQKSERCFGGFKHNYQSAKILTNIEEKNIGYCGLNTSVQVVEGVLKHTKLKPDIIEIRDFLSKEYLEEIKMRDGEKQVCATLEGQVVALADEIAQRGHDVDDALTSGVMSIDDFLDRLNIKKCNKLYEQIKNEVEQTDCAHLKYDIQKLKIVRIVSCIVRYFVDDAIANSTAKIGIYICAKKDENKEITMQNEVLLVDLSSDVKAVSEYLEKIVQRKVICNNEVARADYNADVVIRTLFKKYYENPRLLHEGTVRKIYLETLKHPEEHVAYSAVNMGDASVKLANEEIADMAKLPIDCSGKGIKGEKAKWENLVRFEKRKILVRAIVDFIAGMTDGYALEEYEKLK